MYNELKSEFKILSSNSITESELNYAKKTKINHYNNRLHNPRQLSTFIQDNYNLNGYSLDEISNKWKYIQSVTLKEINDVAAKMFDPNNFMMVVIGNKDSCETFLNQFQNVEYYDHTEELRTSANIP